MSSRFIKPLFAACLALGAAQSHAAAVMFQGFANGSETVNYSLSGANTPSISGATSAGGFMTTLDGQSLLAYCIDLYQHISFNTPYAASYTQVNGSAHVFANTRAFNDIGRLFSAGHEVNDSVEQAAFQIAIWELTYETSPNEYDLALGDAKFTGGSAANANGALALADSWLDALGLSPNTMNVQVLESGRLQDQVFANRVPEPSSAALIFAAMMGLGAVQRRRARKPA